MMIFTIDARDFILWDLIIKHNGVNPIELNKEILDLFELLQKELKVKGLKYNDFKSILMPQKSKNEIALVFDSHKIDDIWYGGEIMHELLPTLFNLGKHSIFTGDLIAENQYQDQVFKDFKKHLIPFKPTTYTNSGQYYLVYINNLSDAKVKKIIDGLLHYEPFIGVFDFTYGCRLKSYVASTISQRFLILGNQVIVSAIAEEDTFGSEHDLIYDFGKYDFDVICIGCHTYSSFLSYKIEREVSTTDVDTQVSISSINQEYSNLYEFDIVIDDRKFEYLMNEKSGSISRLATSGFDNQKLQNLIKFHIKNNYIYNLDFISDYQVSKFNIMLELPVVDSPKKKKFLVALEYMHNDKELRLITMY